MKKITPMLLVSAGLIVGTNTASASMADQLIYNVLGQVTNATGARLGDEIYYGSSGQKKRVRHVKHRKVRHKKKRSAPVVSVMTDEKRIQKALRSLGFYRGPIDGEVNSFETRSAIKEMNIAYGISNNASLKPEVKDSLIFLGTLFAFDRNLIAKGTDKRTKGKKIQTALKIHGFYHTKIDGAVGSGTKRSIAEYKASQGLSSGNMLDFEEEYQLISSAKEINDKNIEDTLASLKSLGTQYQSQRMPVANTMQRGTVYRQQMQPGSVQQSRPQPAMQQARQPVQHVQATQTYVRQNQQPVQQAQTVQPAQPTQVQNAAVQQQVQNETVAIEGFTGKN